MKTVKVFFRRKRKDRGAIKVYTTVRLDGAPKQIHICYVSEKPRLSSSDVSKVESKLQTAWAKHVNDEVVAVDWDSAYEKYENVNQPKAHKAELDRAIAMQQIHLWMAHDDAPVLEEFGDKSVPSSEVDFDSESFRHAVNRTPEFIANRLRDYDSEDIRRWWLDREVPRLLHRFYAFCIRRSKDSDPVAFGRLGFLKYLKGNIVRYAAKSYLRQSSAAKSKHCKIGSHYADSHRVAHEWKEERDRYYAERAASEWETYNR